MDLQISDYNGATRLFEDRLSVEWTEIREALEDIPLYLKPSDEQGRQETLIFNPVGTNKAIHEALISKGWAGKVPVPAKYKSLGKDVDFAKSGVLVEVQFSNYPFVMNNSIRAELLKISQQRMGGAEIAALVIIAKANMFPASQSTLYYEQAKSQLQEVEKAAILKLPIRLVGLFVPGGIVSAKLVQYHAARTSRTEKGQEDIEVDVALGKLDGNKSKITRRTQKRNSV